MDNFPFGILNLGIRQALRRCAALRSRAALRRRTAAHRGALVYITSVNCPACSIGDAGLATCTTTYSFVCRASACSIEDAAPQRAAVWELLTSLLQFSFGCRASACSVGDAAPFRAADCELPTSLLQFNFDCGASVLQFSFYRKVRSWLQPAPLRMPRYKGQQVVSC